MGGAVKIGEFCMSFWGQLFIIHTHAPTLALSGTTTLVGHPLQRNLQPKLLVQQPPEVRLLGVGHAVGEDDVATVRHGEPGQVGQDRVEVDERQGRVSEVQVARGGERNTASGDDLHGRDLAVPLGVHGETGELVGDDVGGSQLAVADVEVLLDGELSGRDVDGVAVLAVRDVPHDLHPGDLLGVDGQLRDRNQQRVHHELNAGPAELARANVGVDGRDGVVALGAGVAGGGTDGGHEVPTAHDDVASGGGPSRAADLLHGGQHGGQDVGLVLRLEGRVVDDGQGLGADRTREGGDVGTAGGLNGRDRGVHVEGGRSGHDTSPFRNRYGRPTAIQKAARSARVRCSREATAND